MPKGQLTPEMIEAQWKPGQSGNPKGRPKRKSFETIVAEILDEPMDEAPTQTKREALAREFVALAFETKSSKTLQELLARLWPAIQKHQVSDSREDPPKLADTPEHLSEVRDALEESGVLH